LTPSQTSTDHPSLVSSSLPHFQLSQIPTVATTNDSSIESSLNYSQTPSINKSVVATHAPTSKHFPSENSSVPSQLPIEVSSLEPSSKLSTSPTITLSVDAPLTNSLIPSRTAKMAPQSDSSPLRSLEPSVLDAFLAVPSSEPTFKSSQVPLLASSVQTKTPTAFSSPALSSSQYLTITPTLSPSSGDSLTSFTQTHPPSLWSLSSSPTNAPQEDLSAFPSSRWLKLSPSLIPISPPATTNDISFRPSFFTVVLSTKPSEPRNIIFPTTYFGINATFVFVGNFTYLLPEKDIATFEDITAESLSLENDDILEVSMFSQDISLKSSKSRHHRLRSLSPQDDAGNWTASLFIKSSRVLANDDLHFLSVFLTTNAVLYTDRLTNILPKFFNQIANSSESFTFNFLSISSNLPTKAPSIRPSPSFSSSRVSNMPTALSSMITQGGLAALSAAVSFTYTF